MSVRGIISVPMNGPSVLLILFGAVTLTGCADTLTGPEKAPLAAVEAAPTERAKAPAIANGNSVQLSDDEAVRVVLEDIVTRVLPGLEDVEGVDPLRGALQAVEEALATGEAAALARASLEIRRAIDGLGGAAAGPGAAYLVADLGAVGLALDQTELRLPEAVMSAVRNERGAALEVETGDPVSREVEDEDNEFPQNKGEM